jgi:DNA-binding CsgD family transcriptional regulator
MTGTIELAPGAAGLAVDSWAWPLTGALPGALAGALVGRDTELAVIGEFLRRAGGRALILTGEPGVGKTALLDAAAEQSASAGIAVLRASGVESETGVPFAGLHQIFAPLAEEFGGLSGPHRAALTVALGFSSGPAPDHLLVCNATLTLVRSVSQARPLLLVVDDLHWLDQASAVVLGFLARRLAGTTAGLLAAALPYEPGSFMRTGLAELELRPLDEAAASRLMSSAFPLLPARTRQRLLAQARGNPLALLELPRVLGEHGHQPTGALGTVLPLGRRLREIYTSRLAELPERSRDALLMLALGGTDDPRLPPADGPRDLPDLGPAERARLVDTKPGSHQQTFCHPLIRAAVIELSTGDERRGAHRRLAELSDQPERRAFHLGEATVQPDEEVATLLEHGAQASLRRGDGGAAVAMLIRAAELSPAPRDRSRRLGRAAYIGATVTGDLHGAEALLAEARHAADTGQADTGQSVLAETAIAVSFVLLNRDGDVATAHRLLLRVIETADPRDISTAVAEEALRMLMLVSRHGGRAEMWEPVGRQLRGFGPELPVSLYLTANVAVDPVRSPKAALDRLDAEIAALPHLADPAEVIRIADTATFVDRLPGCRQALRRVIREEADSGAATSVIHANILLAVEAYLTGQWDEAQRLAEGAADLCDRRGYRLLQLNAQAIQAFLAAGRGETALAQAMADEMTRWAVPRGVRRVQADALYACVLAALAQSDFETAYQNAVRISPAGQLVPHEPHAPWVMLDLVEAALRTGRPREAALHVDALRQADVARISPRLALLSGAASAMIASDDEAAALFARSLAATGAERWPFDLARVHLLYGERLRRGREMTRSRIHLGAAYESFRRLGAIPWAQRAAVELRAAGRAQGHRRHDELTPQELEIASLAAAGLSNKQIGSRLYLSHRTVGAHLYRIFPKLGITSRAALRDALAQ